MKIVGIIPARYDSTRFPGKPLVDLMGKPMIQRVVEKCEQAEHLNEVIVATDDERIANAVRAFGGQVVLTSSKHQSGTDRCAEAVEKLHIKADYIINIQGDEPLIQPEQIDDMCFELMNKQPELLTLVRSIKKASEIASPNVVKVVLSNSGHALYFSRSVIPYPRAKETQSAWQHIGIYAYRRDVLQQIVALPLGKLERMEQLEQLRWLENDYTILTMETNYPTIAIDTPNDVDEVLKILKNGD